MSTNVSFNTTPSTAARGTGVPKLPRRRRWWLVLLGLAVIAGSVLGVQAYVSAANRTEQVLVLARGVPWDRQITEADLAVAQAVPGEEADLVPADERDRVIGRFALYNLPVGSLLMPEELTEQQVPGPGQVMVGLLLKPGELPARGLHPQDPVQISAVSQDQGSAVPTQPAGQPVRARVVDIGAPDPDGAVTVDVVVSADEASAVTAASAGPVTVSLLGPDG